jgi:glycosyltransferase involved in cell wall biosynthesis
VLALAAERWTYRPARSRILAAVSRGTERELERYYPGAAVAVIPNGVDPERFAPDPETRRRLRGSHAADEDVIALFAGGDWDRKGLGIAIEALALAVGTSSSLRLWVVGPGDERRFRKLAARLGVEQRVTFFGPRSDVERYYQAGDLLVFPTLYESFSLIPLEAASSGIPLIATRVYGVNEVLRDGDAGIAVERSPAAVADALVTLATRPEQRMRMGEAARRGASVFTWERAVGGTLEIYDALLAPTLPETEAA